MTLVLVQLVVFVKELGQEAHFSQGYLFLRFS